MQSIMEKEKQRTPPRRQKRRQPRVNKMTWQRNRLENLTDARQSKRIQDRENRITMHSSMRSRSYEDLTALTVGIRRPNRIVNKKLVSFIGDDIPLPPRVPKSPETKKFLMEALTTDNFIFAALTDEEMELLIGVMREQVVTGDGPGTVIVDKNDIAQFFYIVGEGTVKCIKKDFEVVSTTYKTKGSAFGEMALLFDTPNDTTYVTDSDSVTLWKLDQHSFRVLLAKNTESHEQQALQILQTIPLFQTLEKEALSTFSRALTRVTFKENERIVSKGGMGEVFYIITEGQVRVHDIGSGLKLEDQHLGPGQWFGERTLLTGEPRAANVTAITDRVTTLAVNRETFESVIGSLEDALHYGMKKDSLKALPRFARSSLLPHELDELAGKITEETFPVGYTIQSVGDVGFERRLVIIRSGQISVTNQESEKIRVLREGDCYGSRTLLDSAAKQNETESHETAICDEDTEVYVLRREDLEDVIEGDISRLGKMASYKSKRAINSNHIQFCDLKQHRVLGKGAFGSVYLCTHKNYKEPFALKSMDKRDILDQKMVKFIVREKDILEGIEHPFILPMYTSFQDNVNVYLLLKVISGGELFYVIHDTKKNTDGLSNDSALFYSACIYDALSYIHHRHIVYRDLKPENILIDTDGYCVIVDFGFAKIVATGKTYTLCGTPDYLAPELILSKGHNTAADYWSLGVCIYEMLLGKTPFYEPGKDQTYMFTSIVKQRYTIPEGSMNEHAKDLITRLLEKNVTKRLGVLPKHAGKPKSDGTSIREHPWFKEGGMDFDKLVNKEIPAPWIPKVKDVMDLSNFDNNKADNEQKEKDKKNKKKKKKRRKIKEDDDALFDTFGA